MKNSVEVVMGRTGKFYSTYYGSVPNCLHHCTVPYVWRNERIRDTGTRRVLGFAN